MRRPIMRTCFKLVAVKLGAIAHHTLGNVLLWDERIPSVLWRLKETQACMYFGTESTAVEAKVCTAAATNTVLEIRDFLVGTLQTVDHLGGRKNILKSPSGAEEVSC